MSRNASTWSSSYSLCDGISPRKILLKTVSGMATQPSPEPRKNHCESLSGAVTALFGPRFFYMKIERSEGREFWGSRRAAPAGDCAVDAQLRQARAHQTLIIHHISTARPASLGFGEAFA